MSHYLAKLKAYLIFSITGSIALQQWGLCAQPVSPFGLLPQMHQLCIVQLENYIALVKNLLQYDLYHKHSLTALSDVHMIDEGQN